MRVGIGLRARVARVRDIGISSLITLHFFFNLWKFSGESEFADNLKKS